MLNRKKTWILMMQWLTSMHGWHRDDNNSIEHGWYWHRDDNNSIEDDLNELK